MSRLSICEVVKNTKHIHGLFFQLNNGSVGFYRTQYTSEMLDKLLPAIKDKTMPSRDRLGLQNDLFAMVRP